MRNIKFRAWNNTLSKMQEVSTVHYGLKCVEVYSPDLELDFSEVVLMQYTGMHDKEGTEMYEGDIVRVDFDRCYSEFINAEDECGYYVGIIRYQPSKGFGLSRVEEYVEDGDKYIKRKIRTFRGITQSRATVIGCVHRV